MAAIAAAGAGTALAGCALPHRGAADVTPTPSARHAEDTTGTPAQAPRCACGLVDVHSHFLPPDYAKALADHGLVRLDGGFPVPAWSEERLFAHMDRHGIEASMLSVSSPGVDFVADPPARLRLTRSINEFAASLVRRAAGRLGAFATLPLPDVAASLREIDHALDHLGLDGVVMETNGAGVYLGDSRLEPIFRELNRRRATVFLHPTSPACFEAVGLGRPAPILEFPIDTARTITDLIYAGTLVRHPDVRLIVPHAGGALTALAERIAAFSTLPFVNPRPAGGPDEVRRMLASLYYDLAGSATDAAIERLRRIAPLDHVVFGSDFPFTPDAGIEANVRGVRGLTGLRPEQHESIARNNALRLFPKLAARGGAFRPIAR